MTTAAGSTSIMLAGAEELIAASTTFQAAVGAASAAAAKSRIYFGEACLESGDATGETLAGIRPFVVLNAINHSYEMAAIDAASHQLVASGGVLVVFQGSPSGGSFKDAWLAFENYVGGVIDEVAGLCGADRAEQTTYFPFRSIDRVTPSMRSDVQDRQGDDFFIAEYLLRHAVNG